MPMNKSAKNPLFRATPRNFNIGGDTLPKKRNLGRFVRWPKYVRIQRQASVQKDCYNCAN